MKRGVMTVLVFVMAVSNAATVFGQEEPRPLYGFIFSADNLLLDLESYQGGIGAKADLGAYAVRGLLSVEVDGIGSDGGNETTAFGLGVTLEKPFFDARVTPYWGGFVDGTYSVEKTEVDGGDTTKTQVVTAGFGPVLGAEFFVFPHISVFAEYALAFRGNWTSIDQEVGGVSSSDETSNFGVGSELGNGGMIGIVIYLDRNAE